MVDQTGWAGKLQAYHEYVLKLHEDMERIENQHAAIRAELLTEIERQAVDIRKDTVSGLKETLLDWEKGRNEYEDAGAPKVVRKIIVKTGSKFGLYVALGLGFIVGNPEAREFVFGWLIPG